MRRWFDCERVLRASGMTQLVETRKSERKLDVGSRRNLVALEKTKGGSTPP